MRVRYDDEQDESDPMNGRIVDRSRGPQSVKILYKNQQDKLDPLNGAIISEAAKLSEILEERKNYPPFFIRLSGDNGFQIIIGIGGNVGCVQYSRSDGELPYLMAVPSIPRLTTGDIEFLAGNMLTPVPARNILSFDELRKVVEDFASTGKRSSSVLWEPV